MRLLFDIETDGLLAEATRMWLLVAQDVETGMRYVFREGDLGWQTLLQSAKAVCGHNILGYDLPALQKLFNWRLPDNVHVVDTLVMSRVLNYMRFGTPAHGLGAWGNSLGFEKIEFSDFSQYTPEMETYCIRDVELNIRVLAVLQGEFKALSAKAPRLRAYMQAEHEVARWCGECELQGWPFDVAAATALAGDLRKLLADSQVALTARLGKKVVAVDKCKGEVTVKHPKWIKCGMYDLHTANWFGVAREDGLLPQDELPIAGPFCRVEVVDLNLSSPADVKIFLNRHGWQPTEWNFTTDPDTGKKVQSSPKITEDSLEFLGGDGKRYSEYVMARSRYAVLATWLENVDKGGGLHGGCVPIGTPSMRARHQIIVNVPSTDKPYGPEMRKLFISRPGWTLIGADSSGNQARGLAHYLGDEGFIKTLLEGDIHQYNANILTEAVRKILSDETVTVSRGQAKRILYAFLFGAAGAKLWSYIFGTLDKTKGDLLKAAFIKAVPGFKGLLESLNSVYGSTSKRGLGYIPSIAGNRVYVDSRHKLLVYLLQSMEKVTCAAALEWTVKALRREGIPYVPLIFYHDEIDFMVPDEYAERAAALATEAFKEAPKIFGVNIMAGEAKLGHSWYDVH